LTVVIGLVQIVIAIGFIKSASSALNLALSVASLINGPILGVFLVGTFLKKAKETHALIGMAASICLMIYILLGTKIAWTWYALIGSLTTFFIAFLASLIITSGDVSGDVRSDENLSA
jgi:Na+/proline symporter